MRGICVPEIPTWVGVANNQPSAFLNPANSLPVRNERKKLIDSMITTSTLSTDQAASRSKLRLPGTIRQAFIITAVAGFWSLLAAPAGAALFLSESFNYTSLAQDASLDGQTGGTGWSAGWSANTAYDTAGLTNAFVNSSGGAAHPTSTGGTDRPFDITGRTADGQVQWTSFLIDPSGSGRFLFFSGGSSSEGFGINFNATTTSLRIAGSDGATSANWGTGTNLVIMKSTWSTGADLSVDLWLNPADVSSEGSLGAETLTGSGTSVAVNGGLFPRGNGTFVFDEVRMGDSLSDVVVVPEPSVAALVLVGSGLLLIRRKQRGNKARC